MARVPCEHWMTGIKSSFRGTRAPDFPVLSKGPTCLAAVGSVGFSRQCHIVARLLAGRKEVCWVEGHSVLAAVRSNYILARPAAQNELRFSAALMGILLVDQCRKGGEKRNGVDVACSGRHPTVAGGHTHQSVALIQVTQRYIALGVTPSEKFAC